MNKNKYNPNCPSKLNIVNMLEYAFSKSDDFDEVMQQLSILGWSKECQETILAALDIYKQFIRKDVTQTEISTLCVEIKDDTFNGIYSNFEIPRVDAVEVHYTQQTNKEHQMRVDKYLNTNGFKKIPHQFILND